MSFPACWNLLPGPSHLLEVVVSDIVAGYTVALGVPADLPKPTLAVEVSERIHARKMGRLFVFRDCEMHQARDQIVPVERFARLYARDIPVLIDLRGAVIEHDAWFDYLRTTQDFSDWPSGLIVFEDHRVSDITERKGFRCRQWCDYVGRLDCSVLLRRTDQRSRISSDAQALKDALVGELAGGDIGVAHRLITLPIERLLDESTYSGEKIWAAQVSVLFPIVDRERRRMLQKYSRLWIIPYQSSESRTVGRVMDLEIRDMVAQAEVDIGMRGELRLLRWLRRVRNLVAHMKVVSWGTLVSPDASRAVSFRE